MGSEGGSVNSLTLLICSVYGWSRFQWPEKAFRRDLQVLPIGRYYVQNVVSAWRICEITGRYRQHLSYGPSWQRGKGEMVSHVSALKIFQKGSVLGEV